MKLFEIGDPWAVKKKKRSTPRKVVTRYRWEDDLGNAYILMVRDDDSVVMTGEDRMRQSLANVGFMINHDGGIQEEERLIRDAALKGLDELRRVTQLDWEQI